MKLSDKNSLIEINKNVLLVKYFDHEVVQVFTEEVKNFIVDYLMLSSRVKMQDTWYYDYSFIILPLCKALEKHLFNILRAVGYISIIPTKEHDITRLGAKMNDAKKSKSFEDYLKSHNNSNEFIKLTLTRIQNMSQFWNEHRNLPLHVDGLTIPSITKAEMIGLAVINEINSFTRVMAKTGVNDNLNQIFKITK